MRIPTLRIHFLLALCAYVLKASEVESDEIKALQDVVEKIEEATLQSKPLHEDFSKTERSLVLRCWLSTIYTPLSLIYKFGHKVPLFSEKQSKSGELIQFARLTVILPSKQETLNLALQNCPNSPVMLLSYFKFLRAVPAFEEKKRFILEHVYNSDLPAQHRLLMRAFCYILFNSLDFVMLSPSLLPSPAVRLGHTFHDTSTTNLYEFLRYTLEIVEQIGESQEDSEQLSDHFLEAIEIEERFYDQFLGDLLDDEHMNVFKTHLKTIGRDIIKIVTKEGFQLTSRLPLEYIRL